MNLEIVDINKKACEDFGYTKKEFLELKFDDLVIEEQKELFKQQHKLMLEQKTSEFYLNLLKKDFLKIPTFISASIIDFQGEKVTQVIIRDVTEEIIIDEERVKHIQELMFLSKTAFDFVSISPQEIYNYITEKIKELVGDAIIVAASFNPEDKEFIVKSITGIQPGKIFDSSFINPIDEKITTNIAFIDFLKQSNIAQIPLSLVELSNGLINEYQEDLIKRIYNIQNTFAISFVFQSNLSGVVIVLLRRTSELPNIELLETFANQASVALVKNQAVEEMQNSEERYRKLFSDSYDGILLYNDNLEIIDTNQKANEFIGYKNGVSKIKITDFIPKNEIELFKSRNNQIFRDGFAKFDMVMQNKTGRLISVEIVANLIEINKKEVVQFIFRDITQRKITEEIRMRNIDTLRFISKTAMDFVGLSPEENLYQFIGERIAELAGDSIVVVSSYEEAFGKFKAQAIIGISKFVPEIIKILGRDPSNELISVDEQILKMQYFGKIVKIPATIDELTEQLISKKHGELLWKLLNLGEMHSIAFTKGNKLFGTVLITMKKNHQLKNPELIEVFGSQASVALLRKQAEEELRRSEQRFKDLIETMNDGFGVDDKNGVFIYVNERLCQLLGYPSEEIIGKPVTSFLDEENIKIYYQQTSSRNKEYQESYEIYWKREDGEAIPTIVSPRAFIDTNGNYQGSYAVITDITERKRFEEKLLQQQIELQKQKDELESFASTIAHDLRGKMQIISLYNSLSETEYSNKITKSIEEMSDFIEDLLFLAKKGEILGEKEEINLTKMINALITTINSLAPEITFKIRKLPKIYSDPIKLNQVFENILMNIVKHAEATTVEIYVEESQDYYDFYFKDNGKGISEKKKQEIIDSWTTNRYVSFGMLIILRIVQAHNGHIIIESEEGKGTTFIVQLPKKIK